MRKTNSFPHVGRCIRCGRFIKRGLWNFIKHDEGCPERKIIIFTTKYYKLIKQKDVKKYNTSNRNSRLDS